MNIPISVKKLFYSLLSFLLALTLLLSFGILPNAFAVGILFSGVEDKEVAENTVFDLLQDVTATDADGTELPLEVTNVVNTSDPSYVYDGNPNITVGKAGNKYQVEYTAYFGNSEKYTAERTIVSIKVSDSGESQENSSNNTSPGDLPQAPESDTEQAQKPTDEEQPPSDETQQSSDETQQPSDEMQQPSDEMQQPSDETQQPSDETQQPSEEEPSTEETVEDGIPIIFENGLHYVEDPDYPNERIILYCMNNKLGWPHATPNHPNVPDYYEGYLTPDKFQSENDYQTCLQRLKKLLFAGYPYNGERLYKIISTEEQHVPTEQEFNEMLILPPQLETAFPYLAHHRFTLDDIGNPKHTDVINRFMGEVIALRPDKVTPNGLHYDDIIAMPYYKAVNALTYGGAGSTKEDVLGYFSGIYSDSYFVTETQAYDATQLAVWRLLNSYGIEHNDITSLESNNLAQVLWLYSLHGDLLTDEPIESNIRVEGDLTFTYNNKDGMWHSGTLKIIEPTSYNGLYELILPEGVTALCDGLTYVYGNEPYELVADKRPADTSSFAVKTHIDWLKDMKQYSPINSQDFQSMIGAVIVKTNFVKVIPYKAQEDGSLHISKAVIGNAQDQTQAFNFILELSDKSYNGLYGDLEFHNGVAQFTLKNGESVTAQHLPIGINYKITEVDADGYLVEVSNGEGTIATSEQIAVVFTNTKLNSLILSKTVEGEMGDKTKSFTFEISLKDSDGVPLNGSFPYFIDLKSNGEKITDNYVESGTLAFQDGVSTVHLSHGQQIHISDIPYGTQYSITEAEADQDGYTTSFDGSGQNGTLNEMQEIHVTNRKEYVPETGIRDTGNIGISVLFCVAAFGLFIPVLYKLIRKKRFFNQ